MRVLLTGGGTAGHINPALAIAEIVSRNAPGSEILFVGVRGGKEEELVPRAGYRLCYVGSMGIRRSLSPANIRAVWLALTSPYSRQTTRILEDFRPDIVIGTGGYACWPITAAAARRGIPTALHESNARPGLAVRRLQKKVDRIWTNFDVTAEQLRVRRGVVRVGNPLRGEFGAVSPGAARRELELPAGARCILSFGGSLGAEPLNAAVLDMMARLAAEHPDWVFLHASGQRDAAHTRAEFSARGLEARPGCRLTEYIYDMPRCMAAADLVISRAGAMTLSELARMGKACILVPSPHVVDDHQYHHARALADAGAAMLVEESALPGGALADAVETLLGDPARMRRMEQAIAGFAGPDANRLIWRQICELTGSAAGVRPAAPAGAGT